MITPVVKETMTVVVVDEATPGAAKAEGLRTVRY
jgi:hypothetical protein